MAIPGCRPRMKLLHSLKDPLPLTMTRVPGPVEIQGLEWLLAQSMWTTWSLFSRLLAPYPPRCTPNCPLDIAVPRTRIARRLVEDPETEARQVWTRRQLQHSPESDTQYGVHVPKMFGFRSLYPQRLWFLEPETSTIPCRRSSLGSLASRGSGIRPRKPRCSCE